jgi:hypothetical protein
MCRDVPVKTFPECPSDDPDYRCQIARVIFLQYAVLALIEGRRLFSQSSVLHKFRQFITILVLRTCRVLFRAAAG